MTSTQMQSGTLENKHAQARTPRWFAFGVANLLAVTALALGFWYLLIDPEWGLIPVYPEPYTALLFWGLISIVWLGFNQEFSAFAKFKQPVKGFLILLVATAISFLITMTLAHLWGRIDGSFAAHRDGGAGYLTGALWVLFAFIVYAMSVMNWHHWPASLTNLRQPWLGVAQVAVLALPTTVIYLMFGLPGLASWATPTAALLDTNTAIGVFYGIVVAVVLTGLLTDNWPWRLLKTPGRIALAATAGNTLLGIALYFGLRSFAALLLGEENTSALGADLAIYPAQIGVCWVFWMTVWSNCFANKPTSRSNLINALARITITFVLGAITFYLYYFHFAGAVLHEPAVTADMSGNALGWMDWWLLWTWIYVLCFESIGLSKLRPASAVTKQDTRPGDTEITTSRQG